jgi:Ca2+-binding RTX toxin-like protein
VEQSALPDHPCRGYEESTMPTHLRAFLSSAAAVSAFAGSGLLLGLPSAQAAVPTCFGHPATVIGTPGDDSISPEPGAVVYGGGGNDSINFSGGYVCGGPGDDNLSGEQDEAAAEHVNGGPGADRLQGYFGVDTLLGGGGDDLLDDTDDFDYGDAIDPGTDILRGGPGDDLVRSTSGADKVYGDAGNDTLYDVTRMTTYLYGGIGNDTIHATGDNFGCNDLEPDYIFGGAGWDTALIDLEFQAADVWSPSTERLIVQFHQSGNDCP